MNRHSVHGAGQLDLGIVLLFAVGLAAAIYLGAALAENRRGTRDWPAYRCVSWVLGLAAIAATLAGPLAERTHDDFAAHMLAHLLVGMLAPLLLVLSAPVTLALRTLPVVPARRLTRLLGSAPARFLTHPVPAAVLNVGSLWALYSTVLGEALLNTRALHSLLLIHFLAAGYLFTSAMVGIDPAPHRTGFRLRLVVLLFAIAAHSILAKQVFGHPPTGSAAPAAELGAMIMSYGGDLLEVALLIVFFSQWFADARRTDARPLRLGGGGTGR